MQTNKCRDLYVLRLTKKDLHDLKTLIRMSCVGNFISETEFPPKLKIVYHKILAKRQVEGSSCLTNNAFGVRHAILNIPE